MQVLLAFLTFEAHEIYLRMLLVHSSSYDSAYQALLKKYPDIESCFLDMEVLPAEREFRRPSDKSSSFFRESEPIEPTRGNPLAATNRFSFEDLQFVIKSDYDFLNLDIESLLVIES